MKTIHSILCFLGFHKWEIKYHLPNRGVTIWECKHCKCGHVKVDEL